MLFIHGQTVAYTVHLLPSLLQTFSSAPIANTVCSVYVVSLSNKMNYKPDCVTRVGLALVGLLCCSLGDEVVTVGCIYFYI